MIKTIKCKALTICRYGWLSIKCFILHTWSHSAVITVRCVLLLVMSALSSESENSPKSSPIKSLQIPGRWTGFKCCWARLAAHPDYWIVGPTSDQRGRTVKLRPKQVWQECFLINPEESLILYIIVQIQDSESSSSVSLTSLQTIRRPKVRWFIILSILTVKIIFPIIYISKNLWTQVSWPINIIHMISYSVLL